MNKSELFNLIERLRQGQVMGSGFQDVDLLSDLVILEA